MFFSTAQPIRKAVGRGLLPAPAPQAAGRERGGSPPERRFQHGEERLGPKATPSDSRPPLKSRFPQRNAPYITQSFSLRCPSPPRRAVSPAGTHKPRVKALAGAVAVKARAAHRVPPRRAPRKPWGAPGPELAESSARPQSQHRRGRGSLLR